MMNKYKDIHEAYLSTLRDVYFNPDYKSAPRGLPVREKLDYSFTIEDPVAEPIRTLDEDRNVTIADYTLKEVELYNSCSNRVEDFAKASKFWNTIANPDGTINSAYGYLIWKKKSHGNPAFEACTRGCDNYVASYRTPWEWAKQSLIKDKDTRQAILRFSLPEHQFMGNKDQTCTMHGNFLIRDDKLHLTITMRSNDLWLGLTYDLPWFVSLMDKMIEELKDTYPNLKKGNYTHFVHSLHLYERDEAKILKALGQ
jgi:thymidylate synthase